MTAEFRHVLRPSGHSTGDAAAQKLTPDDGSGTAWWTFSVSRVELDSAYDYCTFADRAFKFAYTGNDFVAFTNPRDVEWKGTSHLENMDVPHPMVASQRFRRNYYNTDRAQRGDGGISGFVGYIGANILYETPHVNGSTCSDLYDVPARRPQLVKQLKESKNR